MKAHVGVDSRTKLSRAVVTNPANVADSAILPYLLHDNETRVYSQGGPMKQLFLLEMSLLAVSACVPQPPLIASRHVVGAGNFHNGGTDILWQDNINGTFSMTQTDGMTAINDGPLNEQPQPTSSGWQVVGTGDFFQKAGYKRGILWLDNSGDVAIWWMDGRNKLGGCYVGTPNDTNWHFKGTSDFNGDGKIDILWEYDSTDANKGLVSIWFMNGCQFTASPAFRP